MGLGKILLIVAHFSTSLSDRGGEFAVSGGKIKIRLSGGGWASIVELISHAQVYHHILHKAVHCSPWTPSMAAAHVHVSACTKRHCMYGLTRERRASAQMKQSIV